MEDAIPKRDGGVVGVGLVLPLVGRELVDDDGLLGIAVGVDPVDPHHPRVQRGCTAHNASISTTHAAALLAKHFVASQSAVLSPLPVG